MQCTISSGQVALHVVSFAVSIESNMHRTSESIDQILAGLEFLLLSTCTLQVGMLAWSDGVVVLLTTLCGCVLVALTSTSGPQKYETRTQWPRPCIPTHQNSVTEVQYHILNE